MPTVIQERKCVIKRRIPIVLLPNKVIPTVPIINKGPELFVKAIILSASSLVHIPSSLNLETILAPTGYPLINPITKAKAASPGTLNKGRIILFKCFPKKETILVLLKSSVATKNGKSDGITAEAHNINPSFAAVKLVLENKTKQIVNNKKVNGKISFFILKNKKLILLFCFINHSRNKHY